MKDRTNIQVTAYPAYPSPKSALPVAPLTQQDEFVRRARIATAQAAVTDTSKLLANTYLPAAERHDLAREHETNLRRLAVLRIQDGTGTLNDHRLINPKAAKTIEERFWSNDDSWASADRQMAADLAVLNASGAQA